MNYEEKRAMYVSISQMLTDAGLTQATIKQMVKDEIRNKVRRAVDQTVDKLDSGSEGNSYIRYKIDEMLSSWYMKHEIERIIKEELAKKIVKVELKDVDVERNMGGETYCRKRSDSCKIEPDIVHADS